LVPYEKLTAKQLIGRVLRRDKSPINEGAAAIDVFVSNFREQCPSGKVVLSGYSEGAWIIQEFLHRTKVHVLDTVQAVQLYGDPLWDNKSKGQGIAQRFNFGLGSYPYPALLDDTRRIRTYCREGDFICGEGYGGVAGRARQLSDALCVAWEKPCSSVERKGLLERHYSYADNVSKEGGEFLASKAFS
jgi:Cutinase.